MNGKCELYLAFKSILFYNDWFKLTVGLVSVYHLFNIGDALSDVVVWHVG